MVLSPNSRSYGADAIIIATIVRDFLIGYNWIYSRSEIGNIEGLRKRIGATHFGTLSGLASRTGFTASISNDNTITQIFWSGETVSAMTKARGGAAPARYIAAENQLKELLSMFELDAEQSMVWSPPGDFRSTTNIPCDSHAQCAGDRQVFS